MMNENQPINQVPEQGIVQPQVPAVPVAPAATGQTPPQAGVIPPPVVQGQASAYPQNQITQANVPSQNAQVPGAPSAQGQYPAYPVAGIPPAPAPVPQPKPKREYTAADRILLPVAAFTGILYDRLVMSQLYNSNLVFMGSVFWLVFLAVFYLTFWKKLRENKVAWIVAGFVGALCVWGFVFDYRSSYGILTAAVIPCVMMAHAVYGTGRFKLKHAGALALEWIYGWFIKPFSAIGIFFGSIGSVGGLGKNSPAKKVLIGVGISLPLLLILLPLLSGADMVFGYYLSRIIGEFNIFSFLWHLVLSFIAAMFLYSFLWNTRADGQKEKVVASAKKEKRLDIIIAAVVLGMVLVVYTLFCMVQFAYLFAGAGLPENLTYSEYARQGFWQLVAVAAINLLIFGVLMRFTEKTRWFSAMLAGLLAATLMMLVSAIVRLSLYIQTYGLTWLRLISAWFIIYLAAVLILCAVRMSKENLPLISLCAIALLAWYTVLGYANPDALMVRYNLNNTHNQASWITQNSSELSYLSDDAMVALIESGTLTDDAKKILIKHDKNQGAGLSLSSLRYEKLMEAYR